MKEYQKKYEYDATLEEFAPELNYWDDEDVAFIKNDIHEGEIVWFVYSANGTKIAAAESRDYAFILAKQNELIPYSVH